MQQQITNFKELFRDIQILHAALLAGMVMIMIVLKFVVGISEQSDDGLLLSVIGIGIGMSAIIIGHLLYNKKVESIRLGNYKLIEKLTAFREIFIMKLALLEGAALICFVLHYISGNNLLFYTFLFLLAIFAFERPTEKKIRNELRLSPEDID